MYIKPEVKKNDTKTMATATDDTFVGERVNLFRAFSGGENK